MLRRQGSKTPAFQVLKPSTERNRSFEQDHRHLCRVSPTRPDSQEASRSRNPGFKESVSSKRHFKTPVCFKATLVYVMQLRVKRATPRDIPDITALWKLVVQRLGSRLDHPAWSKFVMPEGIYREMHRATVYIVREGDAVIAAFTLSMQKPWSLDEAQFKPATKPLYLTDLAVHPHRLHRGIELLCIRAAIRIARSWPSDSPPRHLRAGGRRKCFAQHVRISEPSARILLGNGRPRSSSCRSLEAHGRAVCRLSEQRGGLARSMDCRSDLRNTPSEPTCLRIELSVFWLQPGRSSNSSILTQN